MYVNRGASQEVIEQNTLPHTYKKVCKDIRYNVQRKWNEQNAPFV